MAGNERRRNVEIKRDKSKYSGVEVGKRKKAKRQEDNFFLYAIPTIITLCLVWAFSYRQILISKYQDVHEVLRLYFHKPLSGKEIMTTEELKKYDGVSNSEGKIYISVL